MMKMNVTCHPELQRPASFPASPPTKDKHMFKLH